MPLINSPHLPEELRNNHGLIQIILFSRFRLFDLAQDRATVNAMAPWFLFLLFFGFRYCLAARPRLLVQQNFPGGTNSRNTAKTILRDAFNDAITLARVVVLTGSDCDAVCTMRLSMLPTYFARWRD